MRREEVLAAPLILLNSIHKELSEIWTQEITGHMGMGMAGMLGGSAKGETPVKKGTSLLGETPQFETKEQYIAYLKSIGVET